MRVLDDDEDDEYVVNMQLTMFWNRATAEKIRIFREDKSHLQFCHVLSNVSTHVKTHIHKRVIVRSQ